jgi:hypothetical protein
MEAWMVTDQQVRRLVSLMKTSSILASSAAKSGMDEKTARKYLREKELPSQMKKDHSWRTREDPFETVWDHVRQMLDLNPGLEAKTIFEYLQRIHPGTYQDGQLRTLQRRIKIWRAMEGPPKEVFFPQEHHPGELSESDFTCMNSIGVNIAGQPFDHLIYHFVLTYSNWETGTICFSESFEALSQGLQNALWELGGVPRYHRTDRLSTAVNNMTNPAEFTQRYDGLMNHYKLQAQKIRAGEAHENGDVEQLHNRFKRALDQALMLRGSHDFTSRYHYNCFVEKVFAQRNAGRNIRFEEERKLLGRLPASRLESSKRIKVRVRKSSTIAVACNVYSVNSRLRDEMVQVRLFAEHLEIWYAQRCIELIPRLYGKKKHHVQYRHIIDWLVRKPGAFANYRYRSDLFPTLRFRMAYDFLQSRIPWKADREYLKILELAAKESETAVDRILGNLIENQVPVSCEAVETILSKQLDDLPSVRDVTIDEVDISVYDTLFEKMSVAI